MVKAADFVTLPSSLAAFAAFFDPEASPWSWVGQIAPALASCGTQGIYLHPSAKVASTATLIGPAWIGPEVEIRPGAYIRGGVIVGAGCVLGNACEFKNCLLLDGVQVPHFSYVGDSVLGNRAHLGAGAILSNLRLDRKPVTIRLPEGMVDTGLRKFGAFLGDDAEVGCNAVLQPGTLLGRRALVMPTLAFGGYLPAATIAKARGGITLLPRRDEPSGR